MYRETILGLALAATLAEMDPPLTARQAEEVWRVFDASMESTVAEAPLMSHISVHIPPPSSTAGGGTVAVSTTEPKHYVPAQLPALSADASAVGVAAVGSPDGPATAEASSPSPLPTPAPAEAFDDSHIAFPVYRSLNGVWTILLKDPTVIVRDELGGSEKIQLDYLRVCLKDIQASSAKLNSRDRRLTRPRKS